MPTYDYICKNCKHELEMFQSMSDAPKKKCPKCGRNTLERQIGIGAAVMFKGSGFYETDYRSESYKKAQAADSEKSKPSDAKTDAKPDGKPDGKSDTKPDAKPDSKPEPKGEPKSPARVETKSASKSAAKPTITSTGKPISKSVSKSTGKAKRES